MERRLRRRTIICLAAALLLAAVGGTVCDARPTLEEMARAQVSTAVSGIIAGEAERAVADGEIDYGALIALDKDSTGRIVALRSNLAEFQRLQAVMTDRVGQRLEALAEMPLAVPLGTLTGLPLLAGVGPKIRLPLQTAPSAAARFRNTFSEAGINQTRHQILLEMEVSVRIFLPLGRTAAAISREIAVGETVIVGSVPQTFHS